MRLTSLVTAMSLIALVACKKDTGNTTDSARLADSAKAAAALRPRGGAAHRPETSPHCWMRPTPAIAPAGRWHDKGHQGRRQGVWRLDDERPSRPPRRWNDLAKKLKPDPGATSETIPARQVKAGQDKPRVDGQGAAVGQSYSDGEGAYTSGVGADRPGAVGRAVTRVKRSHESPSHHRNALKQAQASSQSSERTRRKRTELDSAARSLN